MQPKLSILSKVGKGRHVYVRAKPRPSRSAWAENIANAWLPYTTRALSSTKPSARCMALATCFNTVLHAEKGAAIKGWGQGETGMRLANVTCTAVLFKTVQQLI